MIPFSGTVYRATLPDTDPRLPVTSPEGRFHHDGQQAIYCSLTAEGTKVAIRRYLSEHPSPRVIWPLEVSVDRVADLRGRPEISVVWQDIRANGSPAPTWAFSDKARANGAQAILYSSRSRPDLTHLVLLSDFEKIIRPIGAAKPL